MPPGRVYASGVGTDEYLVELIPIVTHSPGDVTVTMLARRRRRSHRLNATNVTRLSEKVKQLKVHPMLREILGNVAQGRSSVGNEELF